VKVTKGKENRGDRGHQASKSVWEESNKFLAGIEYSAQKKGNAARYSSKMARVILLKSLRMEDITMKKWGNYTRRLRG